MTMKNALALAVAAVAVSLTFTQAAQAGPRLDKIMESKVIRVGTPGDYRPFAIKTDTGFSGHDIDLHETTNTDESEYRPAVAARDGKPFVAGSIPDGFYLVDDTANPQPAFQRVIIEAVAQVTHIAPADEKNEIIGSPVVAPGVIQYAIHALGLCPSVSGARYTTTTEVYPDSPRATPAQCVAAQVSAVCAAVDFVCGL